MEIRPSLLCTFSPASFSKSNYSSTLTSVVAGWAQRSPVGQLSMAPLGLHCARARGFERAENKWHTAYIGVFHLGLARPSTLVRFSCGLAPFAARWTCWGQRRYWRTRAYLPALGGRRRDGILSRYLGSHGREFGGLLIRAAGIGGDELGGGVYW